MPIHNNFQKHFGYSVVFGVHCSAPRHTRCCLSPKPPTHPKTTQQRVSVCNDSQPALTTYQVHIVHAGEKALENTTTQKLRHRSVTMDTSTEPREGSNLRQRLSTRMSCAMHPDRFIACVDFFQRARKVMDTFVGR
jgi:hypothetical protein